jgi:hypothetical protein
MTPKPQDNCRIQTQSKNKAIAHIVWGILLVLAGIGVFFRIPQVMPKIAEIEWFSSSMGFVRFCFYLLGMLLIAGGAKKIYQHYRKLKT